MPGFQFLQTPGPTNVPGRVLRAMSAPTIDHRGPTFAELTHSILEWMGRLLDASGPIVMFSGSGTGGWEAALLNTLAPGTRVLGFDTGHFARTWAEVAGRLGYDVELAPGDWSLGVDPAAAESMLRDDGRQTFGAVMVVHGETSTGVLSDVPACRKALDACGHPGLLLVDIVSSLGCTEYLHDEWGVDVAVGASQKGLLLPPGLAFNVIGERALRAAEEGGAPRSFWDWQAVLSANEAGMFPATPPTNLMFGLREALQMIEEETPPAVFARHRRHSNATRAAVAAWGLETVCAAADERAHHPGLTAVRLPASLDERDLRSMILDRFGVSLGGGLGPLTGGVFRIGHMGDFNDAMLIGVLGAVELGLRQAGLHAQGGVAAAIDTLARERA